MSFDWRNKVRSLRDVDYAYMAGIVDGEGSISVAKKYNVRGINPTYAPAFTVTNTYKPLLDKLKAMTDLGQVKEKPRSSSIGNFVISGC